MRRWRGEAPPVTAMRLSACSDTGKKGSTRSGGNEQKKKSKQFAGAFPFLQVGVYCHAVTTTLLTSTVTIRRSRRSTNRKLRNPPNPPSENRNIQSRHIRRRAERVHIEIDHVRDPSAARVTEPAPLGKIAEELAARADVVRKIDKPARAARSVLAGRKRDDGVVHLASKIAKLSESGCRNTRDLGE
jgi:hypothetical protein